jgi:hypothetical protein
MNKERENGMFMMSMFTVIIFVVLLSMCSCAGKKVITETVVTHDTLIISHTDTLRDIRTVILRDTTHHETERIVTLKESGDTIRIVTNNTLVRYIERTDSTDRYRSIADSLQAIIDKEMQHKEERKQSAWYWQHVVVLTAVVFFIIGLLLGIQRDKKES